MRKFMCVLAAYCAVSLFAWSEEKPIEVKPGEAIRSIAKGFAAETNK